MSYFALKAALLAVPLLLGHAYLIGRWLFATDLSTPTP